MAVRMLLGRSEVNERGGPAWTGITLRVIVGTDDRQFPGPRDRDRLGRPALPAGPPEIQDAALRKLRLVNNARRIEDLRVPPGNRLEALRGLRAGQHSIRINDQW